MKFDRGLVPEGVTAIRLRYFLRAYRWVGWRTDGWPHCPEPAARISRAEISKWFELDIADVLVEKALLEETSLGRYRVTALGALLSSLGLSWWSQTKPAGPPRKARRRPQRRDGQMAGLR